ncbi:MAG: alkaline phosphatase [Tidjanibacter sp.]|nr:alkaline phosphatase [Tidjanibacter sp.]
MKKAIVVLSCAMLLAGCCNSEPRKAYVEGGVTEYTCPTPYTPVVVNPMSKGLTPKNIVFMIGDGMGIEQLSAAWVANRGALNMVQMPYVGLQKTYCLDWLVTDSAAAGTALATGEKTNKGMIATRPNGEELDSMMDLAQQAGKRTGVVVVCRLNDATPATFCCNNPDRDEAEDISADYLTSGVDFIAGGGMDYWRTKRTDGRDIFAEIGQKGYHTYESVGELMEATELPVAAVVAPLEMPSALSGERGDNFRNMVSKSLDMLSKDNDEGFFLMVEGSCIDDWLHANRVDAAVEEILDFDRVVGDVLGWAEQDGETLVVVTADHSTGAMTLLWGDIATGSVEVGFANGGHNGILVPYFAYGAGAEKFDGLVENYELSKLISDYIK